MTGDFKEFKVENHTSNAWDEQNAMASTSVCISSFTVSIFEICHGTNFCLCVRTILLALTIQHIRIQVSGNCPDYFLWYIDFICSLYKRGRSRPPAVRDDIFLFFVFGSFNWHYGPNSFYLYFNLSFFWFCNFC